MAAPDVHLDYKAFDADNHYYEALDAFTRHVPPAMQPRCVQWAEIDGRKYHVVGGRISRAVANATFDPIAKAGAMHEYFRGNPNARNPLDMLQRTRAHSGCISQSRGASASARSTGPRSVLAVSYPRIALRRDPQARHTRCPDDVFGPSTAGSTRTGVATSTTASLRRRTSRSQTSTGHAKNWNGRSGVERATW